MNATNVTVLVTGATGAQGGAVARALLSSAQVRALVRDSGADAARALAALGATLWRGSFDEASSLTAAARGVDAVFSVQLFNPFDPDTERRHAFALIAAARAAGVQYFIQSSVSGAGAHAAMPGWAEGRWDRSYWRNKREIEQAAQDAGFAGSIVIRPAFMMENFVPPKAARMFPDLHLGRLRTAILPQTKLALVAADDIGAAAALAVAKPQRLSTLELAGDMLTPPEIAATLSDAWGRSIHAETVPPDRLIAEGQSPGWVQTQEWLNQVGYPARPADMERAGLAPTRLGAWAAEQASF